MVLKAKATLAEAESTLNRVKQLNKEGITARKDVVSAEAEYERAKADFNFEKDISLNKEVSEAKAEYATAQTEAEHIKDALNAFDAHISENDHKGEHDISAIQLKAPISGTVIERFVNAGSGFEPGKPLLTIANTSTLWVIANVPDQQMPNIQLGMKAQIKLANQTIPATVNYIDPRLNEDTRTGRVRLTVPNPQQRIKVGSFVDVAFDVPSVATGMFVPSQAVQQINDKYVVFVQTSPGKFEPKDITVEPQSGGLVPVTSGLTGNEMVVTDGAFVLKSQLLKGQMGDDD
jgi:cobalt-zinc-cadmium efflux system membrane fusion protein